MSGAPRTRVLVVDDHLAFAESLAMVIGARDDLECVAVADSIEAGLRLARQKAPDVVLLDVVLPDGDGVAAISSFRQAAPGARTLVLTGYMDIEVLTRASAAGASGFLKKESPVEAIVQAIRAARDGSILVDPAALTSILGRVRRTGSETSAPDQDAHLTGREMDVLGLMGEGLTTHAIAERLAITLNTCRGYQKGILAKLGAHSQLEAVVVATRRGILRSPAG